VTVRIRSVAAIGSTIALSLALGACGSSSKSSGGGGGGTVDFYSSLPLQGASSPQTTAMVQGMKLALSQAHNKAGKLTVKYTSLDDSIASTGAWDPGQTAKNARQAAQDTKAVYYMGEFNSGASEVSIPILNQAGLAQVSPANTYVGLTVAIPGASLPGEPDKFYPTGKRTYLRIVPKDTIQAAALLGVTKSDGCKKVAVANDKEAYGQGLATLLVKQAPKQSVTVVSNTPIDKTAPNFRAYAQKIKGEGADCFIFSGITANGAVQINKDVSAAIPGVKLFGPDGICESGFTNPAKKGIPAALAPHFQCTVATQDLSAYPGGKDFLSAFKAKYGNPNPDPYAIYGYEAMKLGLDTVAKLGSKGSDKSAVLQALFATKNRSSVLGTYSFDKNGDTSITAYGLFKVSSAGNPEWTKTLKANQSDLLK
jgi:branched-chain amino acid transport system substrate-binding protein